MGNYSGQFCEWNSEMGMEVWFSFMRMNSERFLNRRIFLVFCVFSLDREWRKWSWLGVSANGPNGLWSRGFGAMSRRISVGLGESPRMCSTGGHFPKIYLEIEIFMRRSTKSSSREGGEDPRQQNRPTWVPLVCHMLPIYLKAVGDFGLRYFFAWGISMEWSPPSKRLGLSQKSLFNLILLLVSVGNIIISWLFGER